MEKLFYIKSEDYINCKNNSIFSGEYNLCGYCAIIVDLKVFKRLYFIHKVSGYTTSDNIYLNYVLGFYEKRVNSTDAMWRSEYSMIPMFIKPSISDITFTGIIA